MGPEVYLSGFPFRILQKKLNYEHISTPEKPTYHYLQGVKAKALAVSISDSWNLEEEVLSWKAFVLKDLADRFFRHKSQLLETGHGNEFAERRIAQEFSKLEFQRYRQMTETALRNISDTFISLSASERDIFDTLLFILERMMYCFDVYTNDVGFNEHLTSLDKWISALLTFNASQKPAESLYLKMNAAHHEIIRRLGIVTKLMYSQTVENHTVFSDRDRIISEFLPEAFDEEIDKLILEQNLSAIN
ncbi:hypothetical protein CHS0354_002019 [Potamilus streckersoni]|uniref:Uncharacterized protein n=1 Tax=Potamilus streckersoni TaxID=2493646 RepID=A0AAE0T5Y2_9BIVA|nr:hypothetical protein CHS0354_002019 [Potamilus streckersoni]